MPINKSTLTTCLQTVMNDYLFGSTCVPDVLLYSSSAAALNEINIVTVADVDSLPNLESYDSPDTILCFLLNLDIFAISSNKKWLTLDGRLLRDDTNRILGFAFSWGSNSYGQLGNNSPGGISASVRSPVSVVGGICDWCQVSAGGLYFSVANRSSGTLWSWGSNVNAQLGINLAGSNSRSSPVSVAGGFTDWCQVNAGFDHSIAIRSTGLAWGWGTNGCGQLGDNATTIRSSPVSVVGGFTDWCQVAAGFRHSSGIRTNGSAWSWGSNTNGQLGDNTIVSKTSPVSVVGGFTDWCQIRAGNLSVLALRSTGTAWSWGTNSSGQLGDNTTSPRSSPVSVVGGFTDWTRIFAGNASSHRLALRSTNTLWSWGCNSDAQLGDNTTTNRSSPVSVVGGFTNWCQAATSGLHSLGVRTNGSAWGWGFAFTGALGDNNTATRSSPVSVVGGFSFWCQVSAGNCSSLGILVK